MSDPLGGLPQAPPPSESWGNAPTQPVTAPSTVVNAVRLMLVGVVLGVISTIVLLATKDDYKRAILENSPGASDSTVDSAITIGVVIAVVLLVLYLLLALQVRKGKNWARIVTWVFAGLGVLGGLSSVAQAGTGINKTFNVLSLLIDIGIIVLLALAPSNQYFKQRRY